MLIRATVDGTFECIAQEHHAFLSGVLAGAWMPTRLDPELVQTIGMHDNPWRPVDADPAYDESAGLPHDFLSYPIEGKVDFYREGLDELESVHPWVAYLVSLHYTTFAGTKDVEALTEPEQRRRERLEARLPDERIERADEALAWVKYFDVVSLFVSLTGPRAVADSVPRWLADPDDWSEAPDETPVELDWADDRRLLVDPWPFAGESLIFDLQYRELAGRAASRSECSRSWSSAEAGVRTVEFVPR